MAVFQLGTAATDKLFLEYILPGLNIQIRENTKLYDRFKTDTEHVEGKYAIFKNLTATPKSARPSSTSTLPTAKQGTYAEFTLYMKRGMYAQLQFDGLAVACGKGKGAVMDLIKAETKGILIYISNYLNRQFWGDGSGRLAQLSAASSASTTVTVDGPLFGQDSNDYTDPSEFLEAGMSVDIYGTGGTLEAEDIEISSISEGGAGTDTLTMAEAVTASNNSYIFDHDTYASSEAAGTGVPQGLYSIINTVDPYIGITQSNAFQGIDRDANAYAKAQTLSNASAAISNKFLLKMVLKCEDYGRIKVIFTNKQIWYSYYEILETDKTLPNEKAMWGGLTGLTFYGGRGGAIPVLWDTDCPDNRVYFIDDDTIQVYAPTQNGMTWIPGDNGILTRVQGKDEWVASLVWYYNMGTDKPQANGVGTAVKHASS